jgi:hypothetical protein
MIEVRTLYEIFIPNTTVALQADQQDTFILQYRIATKFPWVDVYKLNTRKIHYKPHIKGLEHRVVEFEGSLNYTQASFIVTDNPLLLRNNGEEPTEAPTEAPTEEPVSVHLIAAVIEA